MYTYIRICKYVCICVYICKDRCLHVYIYTRVREYPQERGGALMYQEGGLFELKCMYVCLREYKVVRFDVYSFDLFKARTPT